MKWAAVVATLALAVTVSAPAGADHTCSRDGTIPGTGSSVTEIGVEPYLTVYIEDRDFADLDDDGEAGGIWIYVETNGDPGLQRGGTSLWYQTWSSLPDVPYVPPTEVLPPDPNRPVLPNGLTLFPNGFGGGPIFDIHPDYDPCAEHDGSGEPAEPDTWIF